MTSSGKANIRPSLLVATEASTFLTISSKSTQPISSLAGYLNLFHFITLFHEINTYSGVVIVDVNYLSTVMIFIILDNNILLDHLCKFERNPPHSLGGVDATRFNK
jgi:hypothetical protein